METNLLKRVTKLEEKCQQIEQRLDRLENDRRVGVTGPVFLQRLLVMVAAILIATHLLA